MPFPRTLLTLGCLLAVAAHADSGAAPAPLGSAPALTVEQQRLYDQRAGKIVAALQLGDEVKAARVQAIIARQYADLNAIHAVRDARIKTAKAAHATDKTAAEADLTTARVEAESAQDALRAAYLARLGAELTAAQIDQVKDGMTYGVLPLTYRVYNEMLPDLTEAQKAQILAWLTEAREHAMSASTSEEKHAWFGKYKGRINNYLAAQGINLKAAEANLAQRRNLGRLR